MGLSLLVDIHHHIAGPAALLARIAQASRIQNRDIAGLLQIRPVGMAEHHQVEASGAGVLLEQLRAHGNIVIMAVRHQHMVFPQTKFIHLTASSALSLEAGIA